MSVSVRYLERKLGQQIHVNNADELAQYKMNLSEEKMRAILDKDLRFIALFTGLAVRLFGRKRKISVAEIEVDFCNANKFRELYDDMMLNNSIENRLSCLRANPDHYLLKGVGPTSQEVIELTGGISLPSRFVIEYNDFNGLVSEQEEEYPLQAAGASYLKKGICIGAVRHQVKNTEKGCKIKLSVEFPAFLPRRNIETHEKHLAIEFYNWLQVFEKRVE